MILTTVEVQIFEAPSLDSKQFINIVIVTLLTYLIQLQSNPLQSSNTQAEGTFSKISFHNILIAKTSCFMS